MGTSLAKLSSSDSESGVDNDSTWYLPEEVSIRGKQMQLTAWQEKSMGDTTLFLNGPEFEDCEVEDPPGESVYFQPRHSSSKLDLVTTENEEEVSNQDKELITSYDRIPKSPEPNYAYQNSPVRGKRRKQLPGWECGKCKEFYDAAGFSASDRKEFLNKCSKHRSKHPKRSKTPEGFWDIGMLSTSQILKRQS